MPHTATSGELSTFLDYHGRPGSWDELHADDGSPRRHWRYFLELTGALGAGEFARRWEVARRVLHQNSLAYPDPRVPKRRRLPWELDPYPLLLSADEWSFISAALSQRAILLEMVLRDLYGPQRLLRDGLLPAELVYRHPGFRLPYHGQHPPQDRFLHFYAADLARAPDGLWWVLADHCESPSGVGYALQNRIAMSRMLPDVFHQCQVQRLAPYFLAVREDLASLAPRRNSPPRIALFTEEAGSPNYFEDAYVARYLGYTLVEAGDLAVRNNQVMLKTLAGLLPVDVLLRRPESDECDPLELSERSAFGVAGLLQSAHSGKVAIANPLGSGLVESPAFMAFLPQLCQSLLSEPLLMPAVATWWCGDLEHRRYVLNRLESLDVRPAFRSLRRKNAQGDTIARQTPSQLRALIEAKPENYVAQERVARSTAPSWTLEGTRESYVTVRAFAVAGDNGFVVMPGGLTRASATPDSVEASLIDHHPSKDTWVLSEGPVAPVTLLRVSEDDIPIRRAGADLPSRVAESFFWLGRMAERAEGLARILRTVTLRLTGEENPEAMPELPCLLRVLAERGQIEPGFVVQEIRQQLPAIENVLPASVFDEQQTGTLRATINRLAHLASIVRDRMSLDTWRILRQIDEDFWPAGEAIDLAQMLERIDGLLVYLAAWNGLVIESMTRTQAWQFLHLGRRLERALHTSGLVQTMLGGPGAGELAVLEALLEVADSLMTYRSRYLAQVQLGPVLDLLLTDETNPRSLAYQLADCVVHVGQLPRGPYELREPPEKQLADSLVAVVRGIDIQALARAHLVGDGQRLDAILGHLMTELPKLSDAVSHKYLIHTGPTRQLTEIDPE